MSFVNVKLRSRSEINPVRGGQVPLSLLFSRLRWPIFPIMTSNAILNLESGPTMAERPESKWWDAVLARDARRDGEFFFAVSSTGVYCRPSCPARRPARPRRRLAASIPPFYPHRAHDIAFYSSAIRRIPGIPSLKRQLKNSLDIFVDRQHPGTTVY